MRFARAILSLSTALVVLAGVSALSAGSPATTSTEPELPAAMPANGEDSAGPDAGPEVNLAMGAGTAQQADAVLASPDDPFPAADGDPAVEEITAGACDQEVQNGPPPSPDPQRFLCIDIWDGDCFAGCCGPRGRARKWAQCCSEAGGPCTAECQTTCLQQYCYQGPG